MKKYFVHNMAICESNTIGDDTRIWAFTHVLPGARIGIECNICDHVFIENDVIVGDRVTIKNGVQLWDGIRIGDEVFIGPNVTFSNDKFPRSKKHLDKFPETILENGVSIGANATILPGIRIGSSAMIGAGAVVTRDVPPNTIVVGNPARISGYVHVAVKHCAITNTIPSGVLSQQTLGVGDCRLLPLPIFRDMRGDLVPVEFDGGLPFLPRRQFFVFGVQGHEVRGEHAHKSCEQVLVAIRGSVSVIVDDSKNAAEVRLDTPNVGLYIPPMIWAVQYAFDSDTVLVVYASEKYDSDDYIRSYDVYKQMLLSEKI